MLKRVLTLTVGFFAATGCTGEDLCLAVRGHNASCEAAPPPVPDNLVEVEGRACTADPGFLIFPHKVVFVIDRSGSNRTSDPAAARADAAQAAVNQHIENRAISFAVVGFNSSPSELTAGFTRDQAMLVGAIDDLRPPDGGTEYLETLQMVYDIIDRDAEATPEGERGRTTYEVQWLSDGIPDPCQDLDAILAGVDRVLGLREEYSLFDLKMHTIQLVDPNAIGCPDGTPATYLSSMADRGDGTFRALTSSNLDFNIDFTEIRRSFLQRDFYLINENRIVFEDKLWADSDGDGIRDADTLFDSNPYEMDGNDDGCSDRVDQAMLPNDPAVCASSCQRDMPPEGTSGLPDSDFDGLPDCAERMIGTEMFASDHDLDGFSDPIELKWGTDPLDDATWDSDSDWDGIVNADEIRLGLNPREPDSNMDNAYVYSQFPAPRARDGVDCFDFRVENVKLVETLATTSSDDGDNLLCMYLVQTPVDDPIAIPTVMRACKTARFLEDLDIKVPADGRVRFEEFEFEPLYEGSAPF